MIANFTFHQESDDVALLHVLSQLRKVPEFQVDVSCLSIHSGINLSGLITVMTKRNK